MDKVENGVRWNPFRSDYFLNPFPHLEDCRRTEPIQKSVLGTWLFFRHDDVGHILKSDEFEVLEISEVFAQHEEYIFKDEPSACPYLSRSTRMWPMHRNEDAHKQIRSLMGDAFSKIPLNLVVDSALEEVFDYYRGASELNLIEFTSRFQFLVLRQIFGVRSQVTFEEIRQFSADLARLQDSTTPRQVHREINKTLLWAKDIFEDSAFRQNLVNNSDDVRLTDEEIFSILIVSLSATFETTKESMAFALLRIIEDPNIQRWLADASGNELRKFTEEIFRLHSPAQYTLRINKEDMEWRGQKIPKRSRIMLCLAGANRDPEVFENPNELMIDRKNRHLAFGQGIHYCLGAPFARLEFELILKPITDFLLAHELTSVHSVSIKKQVFIRCYDTIEIRKE